MAEKKLGRGLDILIGNAPAKQNEDVQQIAVSEIEANPDQPRKIFDEPAIDALVDSIRIHGLLQPIVVTPKNNKYMIIAGERRWRACQKLALNQIPCIIKNAQDLQILEMALVENLQREDLNCIDRAKAYKMLSEKFSLTQEEIAKQVGKSRASVANSLRLLSLPLEVLSNVSHGTISEGHAKALLMTSDKEMQIKLCAKIQAEALSVREVEEILAPSNPKARIKKTDPISTAYCLELEARLREIYGLKVKIHNKNNKGKIALHFSDLDEFDHLMEMLERK